MPQKKHKPEEIVGKLRQVDVLVSQGRSVAEAVRSIGVTQFTCYRWRAVLEPETGAECGLPHSKLGCTASNVIASPPR